MQGILLFDVELPGGLFSACHFINKEIQTYKFQGSGLISPAQTSTHQVFHIYSIILISKSHKVQN
jgi:hypothetical protein